VDSAVSRSTGWPDLGFTRSFLFRAQVRFLLLGRGASTAVIWTLAALGAAWLKHFGLGALVPWVFATWLLAALPMMYLDLALILDMVGYVFTGKVHFFPTLLAIQGAGSLEESWAFASALAPGGGSQPAEFSEADRRRFKVLESSLLVRFVLRFLDLTSPFSCFSLWAMIVLARIPTSAHALFAPSLAPTMKLEADRTVYAATRRRFVA
jgi:hypothetical protein